MVAGGVAEVDEEAELDTEADGVVRVEEDVAEVDTEADGVVRVDVLGLKTTEMPSVADSDKCVVDTEADGVVRVDVVVAVGMKWFGSDWQLVSSDEGDAMFEFVLVCGIMFWRHNLVAWTWFTPLLAIFHLMDGSSVVRVRVDVDVAEVDTEADGVVRVNVLGLKTTEMPSVADSDKCVVDTEADGVVRLDVDVAVGMKWFVDVWQPA
ncbi:hypothetical protein ACROYT_G016054 [Oculina patagonica]